MIKKTLHSTFFPFPTNSHFVLSVRNRKQGCWLLRVVYFKEAVGDEEGDGAILRQ